jgi:hypothetical protein
MVSLFIVPCLFAVSIGRIFFNAEVAEVSAEGRRGIGKDRGQKADRSSYEDRRDAY